MEKIKNKKNEYLSNNKFLTLLKKSNEDNKLSDELKLEIFNLIENMLLKNAFRGQTEYIKNLMSMNAYETFNKYWKRFDVNKKNEKEEVNAFGYFSKMVENAFFYILKIEKKHEYMKFNYYSNEDIEFIRKDELYEHNYSEINKEHYTLKTFNENDVFYDYNELVYNIFFNSEEIERIDYDYIEKIMNLYNLERDVVKLIKNDITLNEIMSLITQEKQIIKNDCSH